MNLTPQQNISDQEWSIWIADRKITGDTLNTVRRHIQETEMSKWLAAPRKNWERTKTQPYASATYQHQGNHRLVEGHLAWTEKMADRNESEICTRREKHAPMGVLDQQ
jgi:hypothetical protein